MPASTTSIYCTARRCDICARTDGARDCGCSCHAILTAIPASHWSVFTRQKRKLDPEPTHRHLGHSANAIFDANGDRICPDCHARPLIKRKPGPGRYPARCDDCKAMR